MKTFETQEPLEMQLRDTISCSLIGRIQHVRRNRDTREPHNSELRYSCGPKPPSQIIIDKGGI